MPGVPITLYVTPGCARCEAARAMLRERGAEFTEIEVTREADGLRDLLQIAGEAAVPTIVAGADVQVGFDRARIEEMLDRPQPPDDRSSALRGVLDRATAPTLLGLEEMNDEEVEALLPPEDEGAEEEEDILLGAKIGEGLENTSGGTAVEREEVDDLDR